eukprot:TRINITY_DN6500_c0_g1_i2.p1 TRINITY_DN6500_c0_g1~~TRINITY_DN6500_c0_g1_i2.p1  ORF type:complete len:117 (+),score=45.14 TRINITY_DN6500_c0_g1_i2:73-423(+)
MLKKFTQWATAGIKRTISVAKMEHLKPSKPMRQILFRFGATSQLPRLTDSSNHTEFMKKVDKSSFGSNPGLWRLASDDYIGGGSTALFDMNEEEGSGVFHGNIDLTVPEGVEKSGL